MRRFIAALYWDTAAAAIIYHDSAKLPFPNGQ